MKNNLLKLLTVALAASMSLSLFACTGDEAESDTTDTAGSSVESTTSERTEEKTEQTTESGTEAKTETTGTDTESMTDDGETVSAEQKTTAESEEASTEAGVVTTEATVAETEEATTEKVTTEEATAEETTTEEITTEAEESVTKEDKMTEATEYDPLKDPSSIISLNKDKEALVIQGAAGRSDAFGDKYEVLQFVHCSDMHALSANWERMVEWVNYYSDYVSFVIHSGDYCGGNQGNYVDFYDECTECDVPIWNLVGNHDTMKSGTSQQQNATKESVWKLLFEGQCDTWGVTFMDCEYSMAYYQDQTASNTRIICLDMYYDIDLQKVWLKDLLDDAKSKGLHVITVMHEPSNDIAYPVNTAFHTAVDYDSLYIHGKCVYEDIIADFISDGGIHIANLVGHDHHDLFGYTVNGVLNIAVESGTSWNYWCDGSRVEGTKTFDAFNVVSVDTNLGIIKVIRIGDDVDLYLREKRTICYDYINKKIIYGAATTDTSSSSSQMPNFGYTVPEYVNKYMGWRQIASQPNGSMFNMASGETKIDGDTTYYRMCSKTNVVASQIFWTRIGGTTAETWGTSQINPIEVGKARYLVIKMRSNCDIQSIDFRIGTIIGEASWYNQENMHLANLLIPQNVLDGESWTTFVIDLKTTMSGGWVADEDGNYKICYLQYTFNDYANKFASDTYFDFAYMAFVDDWSEIAQLVDVDTVQLVTGNNTSKEIPKTGESTSGDGETETETDGETETQAPVSDGYFVSAQQLKTDADGGTSIGSVELKNDGSFDYVRMTNNSDGVANPNFVHSYADVTGNCGRYMIFKYRTNSPEWLQWGYNQTQAVMFSESSNRTWTTLKNDEEWHVIIVDMVQARSDDSQTHFVASDDGTYSMNSIGFRLFYGKTSDTAAYMDMAYVKWANTLSDAKTLIGEGEDVSAGYYFGGQFVAISIDG